MVPIDESDLVTRLLTQPEHQRQFLQRLKIERHVCYLIQQTHLFRDAERINGSFSFMTFS